VGEELLGSWTGLSVMPALAFQNHLDICDNHQSIIASLNMKSLCSRQKLMHLRVEKVFKKPRAQDCHRSLRQPSDRSPSLPLALDHPKLLKGHSITLSLSIEQAKLR
jgi:hypothetical protein